MALMNSYPGANDSSTLQGLEKQTYAKDMKHAVPTDRYTQLRFKKLKQLLQPGSFKEPTLHMGKLKPIVID